MLPCELAMIPIEQLAPNFPTPALVVDKQAVLGNIERMAEYAAKHHLRLRPHTKTHKSRQMGQWQCQAGAVGLTVAKAGEAEVMRDATDDLLVAYPAAGAARLEKLAQLARRSTLRVAADSKPCLEGLQQAAAVAGSTIGVLLDLDVGFHRTGVETVGEVLELARFAAHCPNLRVDGIFCYPGHLMPDSPQEEWDRIERLVGEAVAAFDSDGFDRRIVSGGSTPTAMLTHRNRWITEFRPGTYIYNDMNEVRLGVATIPQCAATVVATVVSHSGRNHFVVDAGSKTLSSDRCGPAPDSGFGLWPDQPEAKIVRLTEEHGEVVVPDGTPLPTIGSRIQIIPNHICVCVNLQDNFWLWDGSTAHCMPVDARGKLL